ncbi:MAG: TlpA disulfide reductase family protein [Actinomycetota bacterium]|nr:TlpA disulfide reductase family protein [Actinomycetota bacterium]
MIDVGQDMKIYFLLPKKKLILTTLSLFLLTGCATGNNQVNQSSYIEGNGAITVIDKGSRSPAPVIKGELLNGDSYQEKIGNVLVLNVWASWCAPCRAEAPILQELSENFPDVQFLGVLTRDNLESAQAFITRFEITFPSLRNDDILLEFNKILIPNAIPTTLLIDQDGLVAARISGEVTYSGTAKLLEDLLNE